MNEIICPHCHKAFKVDEAGYANILKQVRDSEFEKDIHARLELAEKEKQSAIELAREKVSNELQKSSADKDAEIKELKAKLEAGETAKKLAVTEALNEIQKQLQDQSAQKDLQIQELKAQLQAKQLQEQIAVKDAVSVVEQERDRLKSALESADIQKKLAEQNLKEKYETQIKDRDDAIERLRDMKAKLSTKMVGETLEQHCEVEFNRIRATAFPRAYFEKDNDASTGSKGDFIFRDKDSEDTEVVSIMFALLMVVFMYISFKPVNTRGVGRCHKAMCTHENLTKVCTKLLNRVHKFCVHMHKFWSLFSSFHYVSTGASPACWQTAHATQERALPNSALY